MSRVGVCVSAVASLCLLSVQTDASTVASKRYKADGWSLAVRHDGLTRQTRCRLHANNRRILYQPQALGFAFRKSRDTLGAWYIIDNDAPVRWQDRYPQLIASGAAIDGPGLDNPTGGVVWIPIDEVAHAHNVRIRAGTRGQGRLFRLVGFASMLDAAHRLGCSSDASFES